MDNTDKNILSEPELTEEILKIRNYQSSDALKTDIWKIISIRQQDRWLLYEIHSKGPFISLMFRQNKPN
jgi:hypothetical protein